MTTSTRSAKNGAATPLLGKTEARIFTPPLRFLTPDTSLGFEAIDFCENILGEKLYPWQKWWLIHSLELEYDSYVWDEYPRLRYKVILLLVSRQNGKSYIMSRRLLWRIFMWKWPEIEPPLILGTAHKLPTAIEIMELTAKAVQRSPKLDSRLIAWNRGAGKELLEFSNGVRYKVEAANDDGGRGLSIIDLAFDELRQQRDWSAWSAMTNTTNARFSSQTIAVSNAGEAKSEVLRGLRAQARERIREWEDNVVTRKLTIPQYIEKFDVTTGIFEWSAPEDCDIWDRDGWAQANPTLGHEDDRGVVLVTEQTIASIASRVGKGGKEGIPEHKFRTENLCQFVTMAKESFFPAGSIDKCVDDNADFVDDSPLVLAVDTSHDRSMSYLAVAGYSTDKQPLVVVIAQRAGTEWVAKTLANDLEFEPEPGVIIQGRGAPASSLIEYIEGEGVEVRRCEGTSMTNACSQLYDRVVNGTVQFNEQPALLTAMEEVVIKNLGETFVWNRAKSPVDVAPLCAATYALWGLEMLHKQEVRTTAYGDEYEKWW